MKTINFIENMQNIIFLNKAKCFYSLITFYNQSGLLDCKKDVDLELHVVANSVRMH
jgi:hypothetical protein